jgi:hypothetical protein
MRDLQDSRLMKLKAGLFLVLGVLTSGMLLLQRPEWSTAALLLVAIWSFCRLYYFAFYVIESYVDPEYKFSGVWACLRYLMRPRDAVR